MAETQSSSLSGTIHAALIENLLIAYQFDEAVVTAFFRFASIADRSTTTATFPRIVKSTGPTSGTPASETTALSTTELTTTSVNVAVGRVGIAREITETAVEDSVFGRAMYTATFVQDAARLYGEFFDTASTALFSTVTATVGTGGANLTIATLMNAVAQQRVNKARGQQIISLHDHQAKQLQQDQVAAQSTTWERFYNPSGSGGNYIGSFMMADIYSSGLNPTSAGDKLGAIWSNGRSSPEYCAFGFVIKRSPSSLTESHVLMDANVWASFSRSGVGIIANNFATSIRSVNA